MSDYAVLIMCELALKKGNVKSANQLSKKIKISESAIIKILKLLTKNDLVMSIRGINGGYKISKNLNEISVLDIMNAIDGEKSVTMCCSKLNKKCDLEISCITKHGFRKINNQFMQILKSHTLENFFMENNNG